MRAALLALFLAGPVAAAEPFPADVGGPFRLTDQHGEIRTESARDGGMQLVFFGYASCQAICSVALPLMGEIADLAAARGLALTPVMVTVDPVRDTAPAMAAALARHHPDLLGLTGDEAALQAAYDAFGIEKSVVFEDPLGPVYAHGSFLYLLDGEGTVLSVLPPILTAERIVEIAASRSGG